MENKLDKTKLIINYLPHTATEDDLKQIFSSVGKIVNITLKKNFKTGFNLGFGFVQYATTEEAAKAIDQLSGYDFRNKKLKVSYARPPETGIRYSNLYVKNLPKETTVEEIDSLFAEYGEIIERKVLKDKNTGELRGVAFVRFSNDEEAQAAIEGMDGKKLENSSLPVSVKVADDLKHKKAMLLAVQNQNRNPRMPENDALNFEDNLITEVRHRRPLWDPRISFSERTQSKIDNLWNEIFVSFNRQFSINTIIKTWRTLREDYFVARRKTIASRNLPSIFIHYNQMRFLDVDYDDGMDTGDYEPENSSSKRLKPADGSAVDDFLQLLKDVLCSLPLDHRTSLQMKILQVLENDRKSITQEKS